MSLFVIGDLHLALGCDKPMDIFPGWEGYLSRLEQHWRGRIAPEDTVVLAGDTSWSMTLENCKEDFTFLQSLPARKIILKGNHDYWWNTMSKIEAYIAANGFTSLSFLHNNSFLVEGVALCGTRGWMVDVDDPQDKKILARETGRLQLSLQQAEKQHPGVEKVVILHYPPVIADALSEDMLALFEQHGVRECYYGHLHGYAIPRAIQGTHHGVRFKLISADALGFCPYKIR